MLQHGVLSPSQMAQMQDVRGLGDARNSVVGASQLSEMQHAAQQLDVVLCRLEARITEIAEKLKPVLEDRPTIQGAEEVRGERQMFSPIGRALNEAQHRVEFCERRITGLLETLAV